MNESSEDDPLVEQILRSHRAIYGPITPDEAAFDRIIAATGLPLHERAARKRKLLFLVFEDCMSLAYRFTVTPNVNESHFKSADDALAKARSAISDLQAALRAVEPSGGRVAVFIEDRIARISGVLSEIEEFGLAGPFRETRIEKLATRGDTAFHRSVLSILSGFYELAFSPKQVPARPGGPFERFLNTCIDEMRTAIANSGLAADAKNNALTKWMLAPRETVRSRLEGPRASRAEILELRNELRARTMQELDRWEREHGIRDEAKLHETALAQIAPNALWDTAWERWRGRGGE